PSPSRTGRGRTGPAATGTAGGCPQAATCSIQLPFAVELGGELVDLLLADVHQRQVRRGEPADGAAGRAVHDVRDQSAQRGEPAFGEVAHLVLAEQAARPRPGGGQLGAVRQVAGVRVDLDGVDEAERVVLPGAERVG